MSFQALRFWGARQGSGALASALPAPPLPADGHGPSLLSDSPLPFAAQMVRFWLAVFRIQLSVQWAPR